MYSINVFVTFSLSQLGMSKFFIQRRKEDPQWVRHLSVHLVGLVLCVTILVVTTFEKFAEGGWMTLVITSVVIGLCYLIKGHYLRVRQGMKDLDETLLDVPLAAHGEPPPIDRNAPTAIQLVSGYSGFGVHTLFSILSTFPKTYQERDLRLRGRDRFRILQGGRGGGGPGGIGAGRAGEVCGHGP